MPWALESKIAAVGIEQRFVPPRRVERKAGDPDRRLMF
jgi:hypothetical protein